MQHELSEGLINKLKDAIRESKPAKVYWDYRDRLSNQQINMILALPDGMNQVEIDLTDCNDDYFYNLEQEHIRDILKESIDAISEELGNEDHNMTDDELDDILDRYEFRYEGLGIDLNLKCLMNNSRPRVVLQLGLYHEHQGFQWENTVEYGDVKEVLRLFNINPGKILKSFPNLPYRNGREYILPKDLRELWDNASYGGQYVMPIDLDLFDYHTKRDLYHTGIILHKDSEIWMHDYWNGSGSISIPLQKDLTIIKKDLTYFFGDDNDTAGYGLDQVYGLSQSAWRNAISPIATNTPTPHKLPPADDALRHFIYGNAITDWQISSYIRPFNDKNRRSNGDIPEPGAMMQWDIDHSIWKNFPFGGEKYLKTAANKDHYHCAFKIIEHIGQVTIVHCQFIVDDGSKEIVWSVVKEWDRSHAVFNLLKEKIKHVPFSVNRSVSDCNY